MRQRPAAGKDVTILVIPNRLELPDRVDPLQVAHMLALRVEEQVALVIEFAQHELIHGVLRALVIQGCANPGNRGLHGRFSRHFQAQLPRNVINARRIQRHTARVNGGNQV